MQYYKRIVFSQDFQRRMKLEISFAWYRDKKKFGVFLAERGAYLKA